MGLFDKLFGKPKLEELCMKAKIEELNGMREIRPYEACKKCESYSCMGARHICFDTTLTEPYKSPKVTYE